MKISILCVIAVLATTTSASIPPEYSLFVDGEPAPIFAFQPVYTNPLRTSTHKDGRENDGVTEELQNSSEKEEENEERGHVNTNRTRREAYPGDDQERGRVEVDVNRERGQGTRVDARVTSKVWESRDGNGRVEVQGNYGRNYGGPHGTGRPNYGGSLNYSHRFRREANPGDDQDRGRVEVDVNRERGQGTRVDARVTGKVWESRDGNGKVEVQGNYGRTYGGPQGTGRPNYGGSINYSHRFRREANPGDDQDRGRVEVDVNRERGQGTRVDARVTGKVWESRDGNGRVDVQGNYGRTYGGPQGTGRPNYGGSINYSHRFRREANPGDDQDRGRVEVDVNRERGQGTRVDARVTGKVWESRDGNGKVEVQGNYGRTYGGPQGTGRPNYGGSINYSHRFRREANPGDDQDRGRVEVDVNRERGQGTRVDARVTGKVWESRDGNGRVDVQGNYGRTYGGPQGTGRPNYGGSINYSHRFRREANPGDDQDRGRVEVDVNRERGQGTRVDARVTGKVWESRDGNGRVDVQGNYGRTYGGPQGTGRPNYGGSINYSHRFRREANPGDDQDKGRVEVDVNRERGQGTRVDARVTSKVWESRDGNGRVDVQGNYGRTYGGPQGTGRPNYGGSINYSHRFRREANPGDDQDRGRVEVDVNRERGQGTRVDARVNGKVWESRDGNGRVDVQGNYGRTYGGRQGTGRPNYGGSINYSHRFRREANPGDDQDRGRVEVDVNRERGQGTRVDARVNGNVWESRDGNGRVDVQGNYGRTYGGPQGTGRPNYGGSINYSHRFRREANPGDDQDRGRVEVDVKKGRGQGTRVDARVNGKVWESRDGKGRVEVQGNYGRNYGGPHGTGRPNYGGSINYSHRFRREANPGDDQDRGRVEVDVNRERGQGTRVDARVTGKVWESKDGNGRVDVQGNYGRTYGGRQGTGRPNYGGSINYSHRFRREANPGDDQDRGSVEVDVNRERGQGTRVDARVNGKVWESRDGNGRVEVQGNYGRTYGGRQGTGRPNYGGSINYSHRF